MALAGGSRIGPYEIVSLVGAGGMGEVYRARDPRLNRDVAIKVLPAAVAGDEERLARFEREARMLAALNHPHVATIFGVEEGPLGLHALVMELVEGQTLDDLIVSRSRPASGSAGLPLDEALVIARQIADGLEAAHEKGITHRDLKPANVKITPDGTVKILDFGLAKALAPEDSSAGWDARNSPTLTAPTMLGTILGTGAYMAPEQARGKSVDRRADIWSFGCVLYESLTGKRAFDGEVLTEVIARILERDPDWNALPADTPPDVRRLLARCLTKDPKARLRDIGEARVVIDDRLAGRPFVPATTPAVLPASATARPRVALLPWALTAAIGVAAFFYRSSASPPPIRPTHAEINLPPDVEFYSGPILSADGSTLAFVGVRQGMRQVYTRSLEEPDVRAIAGTDTASSASISPDGTTIAFVLPDTRVRRLTLATGIVDAVADGASLAAGIALMNDGGIVFSRGKRLVVRSREGDEHDMATLDEAGGETAMSWPVVVKGGRTILFSSRRTGPRGPQSRLEAVPVGGGARQVVLDGAEQAVFASADRLVFKRGEALFVAAFDEASTRVTGEPMPIAEVAAVNPGGSVAAAVAASGTFLVAPPSILHGRMAWVSMTGSERPVRGPARGYLSPRVSPNGRLVAFSEAGAIWTLDPERGTFTRVSSEDDPAISFPCWSSDGTRIYYRSSDGIRSQRADGVGPSAVLPNTGATDYPNSMTPDGHSLVLMRIAPDTASDLYATPATGGTLTPIVKTPAYEGAAQVSPDGKWLVYVSNESGRMEVYLQSFGGAEQKSAVSGQGGLHAIWSKDGRRIFYRSGQQMMVVDVTTSPEVRLSEPRVLFDRRFTFGQSITLPNISLSADGSEFLMIEEMPGGRHLNLVLNWLQAGQGAK